MAAVAKIKDLVIGDVCSWIHYGGSVAPIVDGTIVGFTGGMNLVAPDSATINHANTLPAIPLGDDVISPDYREFDYIVVRYMGIVDGAPGLVTREIGIPWIIPGSVTRQYRQTLTIQISDFDESQLPLIRKILRNNGFGKFTTNVS